MRQSSAITTMAIPIRVVESPELCGDYTTQAECEAAGCYWYDDACHSTPSTTNCPDYTTEYECTAGGCYWYDNACHKEPKGGLPFDWKWLLVGAGVLLLLTGDSK